MKILVAAPPEGGKANEAIIRLLASALGVKASAVRIVRGHTQSRKVVQIDGIGPAALEAKLAEFT